jgi:hypothetical protein
MIQEEQKKQHAERCFDDLQLTFLEAKERVPPFPSFERLVGEKQRRNEPTVGVKAEKDNFLAKYQCKNEEEYQRKRIGSLSWKKGAKGLLTYSQEISQKNVKNKVLPFVGTLPVAELAEIWSNYHHDILTSYDEKQLSYLWGKHQFPLEWTRMPPKKGGRYPIEEEVEAAASLKTAFGDENSRKRHMASRIWKKTNERCIAIRKNVSEDKLTRTEGKEALSSIRSELRQKVDQLGPIIPEFDTDIFKLSSPKKLEEQFSTPPSLWEKNQNTPTTNPSESARQRNPRPQASAEPLSYPLSARPDTISTFPQANRYAGRTGVKKFPVLTVCEPTALPKLQADHTEQGEPIKGVHIQRDRNNKNYTFAVEVKPGVYQSKSGTECGGGPVIARLSDALLEERLARSKDEVVSMMGGDVNRTLGEERGVAWVACMYVKERPVKTPMTLLEFWWGGRDRGSAVMTRSTLHQVVGAKKGDTYINDCIPGLGDEGLLKAMARANKAVRPPTLYEPSYSSGSEISRLVQLFEQLVFSRGKNAHGSNRQPTSANYFPSSTPPLMQNGLPELGWQESGRALMLPDNQVSNVITLGQRLADIEIPDPQDTNMPDAPDDGLSDQQTTDQGDSAQLPGRQDERPADAALEQGDSAQLPGRQDERPADAALEQGDSAQLPGRQDDRPADAALEQRDTSMFSPRQDDRPADAALEQRDTSMFSPRQDVQPAPMNQGDSAPLPPQQGVLSQGDTALQVEYPALPPHTQGSFHSADEQGDAVMKMDSDASDDIL